RSSRNACWTRCRAVGRGWSSPWTPAARRGSASCGSTACRSRARSLADRQVAGSTSYGRIISLSSAALERLLDDRCALRHDAGDVACQGVGQQVGDPDEAAAMVALGEDLGRGNGMSKPSAAHGPDETTGIVVEIDAQPAREHAVAEGDDVGAVF